VRRPVQVRRPAQLSRPATIHNHVHQVQSARPIVQGALLHFGEQRSEIRREHRGQARSEHRSADRGFTNRGFSNRGSHNRGQGRGRN
jgi:hypothetical protein